MFLFTISVISTRYKWKHAKNLSKANQEKLKRHAETSMGVSCGQTETVRVSKGRWQRSHRSSKLRVGAEMGKEILLTALDKIKSLSERQGGREGSFTSKNINRKGSYQEIHVSQRHTPVSFLLWKGVKSFKWTRHDNANSKDQKKGM